MDFQVSIAQPLLGGFDPWQPPEPAEGLCANTSLMNGQVESMQAETQLRLALHSLTIALERTRLVSRLFDVDPMPITGWGGYAGDQQALGISMDRYL